MEPQFEDCSYAYRPGRSYKMAVRELHHWYQEGYRWVLDADLVKFFDQLNHERLLSEVEERIQEPWFLELVEGWISAGTLTSEGLILPEKGVPQGSIISPILAKKAIVRAKLWNSRQLLKRLVKPEDPAVVSQAIQKLETYRDDVSLEMTVEQIMGFEGIGAACYFRAMGKLIRHPDFEFTERKYYPPRDPVNALLSFGYSLLLSNVMSLLLAEGLNLCLGNLHGGERPKPYLAFDLMEEFRSPIVDTMVMQLLNQRVIRPTDFTWPQDNGGVYLDESARKLFLRHFEERMVTKTSHPDVMERVSYRRAIHLQIKRYVNAVFGEQAYEGYRRLK